MRRRNAFEYADVAQLVEHRLPKPVAAGSSPVVRLELNGNANRRLNGSIRVDTVVNQ